MLVTISAGKFHFQMLAEFTGDTSPALAQFLLPDKCVLVTCHSSLPSTLREPSAYQIQHTLPHRFQDNLLCCTGMEAPSTHRTCSMGHYLSQKNSVPVLLDPLQMTTLKSSANFRRFVNLAQCNLKCTM